MSLDIIVQLSHRYGSDPAFVVAGGGNTSWKSESILYIKGSGTALADIDSNGFVKMDRSLLAAIWNKKYPESSDARASAVLADMMAAKMPGEETKRPSVETLLHDILPFDYVVHTHPALVNGISCSTDGQSAMQELFDKQALWIPLTNPGYVLALEVKQRMEAFLEKFNCAPSIIFLQNHGIFVAANTADEIKTLYDDIMSKIRAKIRREPDFSEETHTYGSSAAVITSLQELASLEGTEGHACFLRNNEIASLCANKNSFEPVHSAYTPDHIVYAGSDPLFIDAGSNPDTETLLTAIKAAWEKFVTEKKRMPKTLALREVGIFGVGNSEKAANLALELFMDAVKVACYTESFGGHQFMSQDQIDFINTWEVEQYRSKISTK